METLQDALGRRPQSGRDRRAQIGDAGGPDRRMCHTWETQADKAESMLPPAEDRTEHLKRVVIQSVHQGDVNSQHGVESHYSTITFSFNTHKMMFFTEVKHFQFLSRSVM